MGQLELPNLRPSPDFLATSSLTGEFAQEEEIQVETEGENNLQIFFFLCLFTWSLNNTKW